ncbi:MAG TPA: HD domain-containing phosphohydrolase [Nitriliruptorales bacterium]
MSDLRLAEIVAGLSLAADLGTGQPLEHTLRTCLRAVRVGRSLALPSDELRDVYYVSLLRFIGCTATSEDHVRTVGGDEIAFLAAMAPVFMGGMREMMTTFVSEVGRELPPLRRAAAVVRALADTDGAERTLSADCEVASRFASRLGMGPSIDRALRHAFERWDGRGIPGELAGEEVPAAIRIVIVARDAELWAEATDPETAGEVLRRRRGHAYDPQVVDALLSDGPVAPVDPGADALWELVLDAEPLPPIRIDDRALDAALEAFADFTDLKSPYTRGHSRGVAQLAGDAGAICHLDPSTVTSLGRAALVHDLGRVGVPLSVWDRPGPLSRGDRERVRLHPYLTERVLAPCAPLTRIASLACAHHERLDGTGYHRGSGGNEQASAHRILAAADAYQAMTQERAYRPARSAGEAAAELRREAADGRLEPRVVEAVLEAAGHVRRGVDVWPSGLTDREVEVLRLLSRGRTNREVADQLVISPKTVGSHVEHIYTKIGVSSRAAAAVFAMEHHLLR